MRARLCLPLVLAVNVLAVPVLQLVVRPDPRLGRRRVGDHLRRCHALGEMATIRRGGWLGGRGGGRGLKLEPPIHLAQPPLR